MKLKILISSFALILALSSPAIAGGGHDHGHSHDEHEEHEPEKGPHGGRLLKKDAFSLEIKIFEEDVPPQFRVFPYLDEKPIKPEGISVSIFLARFGRETSEFKLNPEGEYLTSKDTVHEPHSFDVRVKAVYEGKDYEWEFESYEGRTELSDEALRLANLKIETAGPLKIARVTRVYGRLIPDQNRVAHISARFPGIIREIRKDLGERVQKGETLAVIESNQSLQPYEVKAQISGEVIQRHATLGEFASDSEEIFVVADLSQIWADFQVYRDEFGDIKKGQRITVDLGDEKEIEGVVDYVSPVTDVTTQSKLVRAVLPNTDGTLRPGLFVSGVISGAESQVAVAVERDAIQTFRDWKVVYLTDGHVFQAMPVELGRHDRHHIEIISGIKAGERYVARNSFIIKADIEKSGASHDH